MRPIWLTNPDTACQIFGLEAGLFDLVVFDEASQLPIEQAVPVIYRGKRMVVAGDEHQLPPTTFFQTGADEQADEAQLAAGEEQGAAEDEDADAEPIQQPVTREGVELALNAADLLTLSRQILPELVLSVHYRSRHPALIEYSNQAFYRGQLEAACPAMDVGSPEAAPIRIHRVNGVYRQQQNSAEARYIVDLLDRLWRSGRKTPTTGVVTFNSRQEKLIEELLEQRAATDHHFAACYREEQGRHEGDEDVGFFVKNLESVQGDERELIVFSTTFGPDDKGTFRRQFGPLTMRGGERRLNVAVTRSKQKMVIVTSMDTPKISDIASGLLPGHTPKARDYLQAYMGYAEAVSDADARSQAHWLQRVCELRGEVPVPGATAEVVAFESPFEEAVCQALRDRGWHVDPQVGQAGFRIDLAVRHPEPEKGYLLAIECDGATYHEDWTARTRDIWRQQILEDKGWRFVRVWSTHWWMAPDDVVDRLCEQIEQARDQVDARRELEDMIPPPPPTAEPALATTLDDEREPVQEAPEQPQPLESGLTDSGWLFDRDAEAKDERAAPASGWGKVLVNTLNGSGKDTTIGEWKDPSGLLCRLTLERHRGRRHLRLWQAGEVIRHVVVNEVAPQDIERICAALDRAADHVDLVDWFERTRRLLHPELDQDGDAA